MSAASADGAQALDDAGDAIHRQALLELWETASTRLHAARLWRGTALTGYERLRQGGAPAQLLVARVELGLAHDAIRAWSSEVDSLVDVMGTLGITPPATTA